jgi:type VI secretion system protein ImpM
MNSNNSIAPGAYSAPNSTDIAGWYGKIPSLGDFVSRRLPAAFIESWDLWLQRSLGASRAQLGERWLKLYLTGPILRFALMPGACNATSRIWTGVLMPSVDKVGRYFPLTIALGMDAQPGAVASIFSAKAWYAELEQAALATLNLDAMPEDLDRRLAGVPFPECRRGALPGQPQELARWWKGEGNVPFALTLPTEGGLTDLFEVTAEFLLTDMAAGKSFWWAISSEAGQTQLHCFMGLPPENYFAHMLEASLSDDRADPQPRC